MLGYITRSVMFGATFSSTTKFRADSQGVRPIARIQP
jgi:hypothetical protein